MLTRSREYRIAHALFAALLVALLGHAPASQADRIKDLAGLAGVRDNQLVGYGLVVGLDGTGDRTQQTQFTVQSLRNMLNQLGIVLPPTANLQLANIAAVMVTANLPAFAKPGQAIDVTVSSIGNANSLRGGSLLMTPLKGGDGQVYAVAQGNVVVGGFGVEAADGSRVSVNVPSAGRIPSGATVEREVPTPFADTDRIVLNLKSADFTTAQRIVKSVDETFGGGVARALDSGSVAVAAPRDPDQRVAFVSMLENIEVEPGETAARVIINSRTGTVVINRNVKVTAAAVTHGSLTVSITNDPLVSQPNPLGGGTTAVVPRSNIDAQQAESRAFLFDPGVSLSDIVDAVNAVGTAPGDLVAILEALKEAGALRADLIVI